MQTPWFTRSTIFWDITPRSSLKVYQCIGGTYCLHLQCRRLSQARYQHESRRQTEQASMLVSFMAYSLTLKMESYVPLKHQFTFNRIHGVIFQKIVLFITTDVRTSNPTSTIYKSSVSEFSLQCTLKINTYILVFFVFFL
jgi:hypothetical protein